MQNPTCELTYRQQLCTFKQEMAPCYFLVQWLTWTDWWWCWSKWRRWCLAWEASPKTPMLLPNSRFVLVWLELAMVVPLLTWHVRCKWWQRTWTPKCFVNLVEWATSRIWWVKWGTVGGGGEGLPYHFVIVSSAFFFFKAPPPPS